jgi:hypothetical protein
MRYEINVSLRGRHFFATHPRSLTTAREAQKVLSALVERFTPADGYAVKIVKWEERGTELDAAAFLKQCEEV